ncbi:MAG TPA: amidohydrolase [Bryobacteraceae bacterium]|nr:amidohydrolase [Bryobacteraceae bacterium]
MKHRKHAWYISLCSIVGMVGLAYAQTSGQSADLLILNGKVYTADGSGKFEEAVAIRGNKVLRVGRTQEISAWRGPKTQVIDAHGSAVIPGFNDTHVHLLSGGLALDNVMLQGARTLSDVQARIKSFARAHPERPWIQGSGWNYGAFPGDMPTRAELDAAVPDRPAVMRCYDGHSIWVNSKALELAHITKSTPNPPNGFIVHDPSTGEPSGLLKETPATALIYNIVPKVTRDDNRRALRAASQEALRYGVTSITEAAGSPEEMDVFQDAQKNGDLPLRVYYSLLVTPGFSEKEADRFDKVWKTHPDTPFLKTGIVKMFQDGVIETNTAFLLANYTNIPSPGKPNYTVDDFRRILQMMDKRGWQFMIHSLGDGAVRMTLDGFEYIAKVDPMPSRGRRNRVEHIETIDPADIPRFGKLGVIASMQPIGGFFVVNPNQSRTLPATAQGVWATNLGPERAARGGMWKSISDAGGRVIFGSDWFVASMDAMGRIYNITHRAARPGGTDQRLSVTAAIDDYTRESAYATFDEKQKGTLAAGMLADIVILASDVFSHEATKREDLAVKTTILDGKVVYQAP